MLIVIFATQFKGKRLHRQANELKVLLRCLHICILFHLDIIFVFLYNSCYRVWNIVSLGMLFLCLKKSKWKRNLWHLISPLHRHIYTETLMFLYYKICYLHYPLLNKFFHTSNQQCPLQAQEYPLHESHLWIRFLKISLLIWLMFELMP